MKIVIDIPDEAYKLLKNKRVLDNIAESIIANGTPLPKGHGRLLILDEAEAKKCFTNFDFSSLNWISEVAISMATLKIIEADKEAEND